MSCASCLEAYSVNITVPANTPIPLNIRTIEKGEFASCNNNGTSNIVFNKCGLYKVSVTASAVASDAAGDITIQLYQDGTPIANAVSTSTAANTTNSRSLAIEKLIQVSKNNSPCCCCSSPSTVTIVNAGVTATFNPINVVVTKYC